MYLYIITGAFILFDLITGIIKAFVQNDFKSYKMRQGLFHKCGSLLCVVFGIGVDIAQTYMDLGVSIPVSTAICAYITLMEVGSIIENICVINPEIMPNKLLQFFKTQDKDKK